MSDKTYEIQANSDGTTEIIFTIRVDINPIIHEAEGQYESVDMLLDMVEEIKERVKYSE